jgi:hypothetical protein
MRENYPGAFPEVLLTSGPAESVNHLAIITINLKYQ